MLRAKNIGDLSNATMVLYPYMHTFVLKISFVLGGNTFYIQIILVSLIVNSLASFIKWLGLSRGLDQIFFGNKKKVITFLSSRLC